MSEDRPVMEVSPVEYEGRLDVRFTGELDSRAWRDALALAAAAGAPDTAQVSDHMSWGPKRVLRFRWRVGNPTVGEEEA